jgi:hypothetical protein
MGIRTKVEIDPASLGITWAANTSYRIAIEEGFVIEDGGDQQPSPAVPTLLSFTTNATGPVLSSSSPASGATSVTGISKVTLTYDRKVIKNTGSIKFYKVGSPATLVQTLNVAESDVYLESDTHQLSFNIVDALTDANSTYYFTIDANAVKDYDNFLSPAISNTGTIRFTTGAAPSIVSTTPADNATGVTNAVLTATFDRNIKKGAGYINIYNASDDSLAYAINVSDSKVTINNTVLSINLTFLLNSDTSYYVQITSTAIRDIMGIYFPGISDKTTWNFATATGSVGYSTNDWPLYYTSYFWVTYPSATRPTATTAQTVDRTAGIRLWQKNSGSADSLIKVFYDGDTPDDIAIATNQLRIRFAPYMDYQKEYYFTIDDGAFYDSATSLTLPGITTQIPAFTFNTQTAWTNQDVLTYTGNTGNHYFVDTIVSNGTNNPGFHIPKALSSTATYTLEISSTMGTWGYSNASTASSTLSITGTRATIYSALFDTTAKVLFYPTKNASTNGTYTVVLKEGSTTKISTTYAMNYSGSNAASTEIVQLYSAGSGTWTPSYAQLTYRPNATVLLVGAGAGGSATDNISPYGTGGGGGGGVREQTGITITNTGYAWTVGTGGSVGAAGGNTTMFGYTANGGSASTGANATTVAGTSGAPTAHIGGGPGAGTTVYGGGGGGAGQNGWTSGTSTTGYYNPAAFSGMNIAYGIDSSILGSLGEAKLGAGGPWFGVSGGWVDATWQYPIHAGNGGASKYLTSTTYPRNSGANGIIAIKLST